MKEYETVYITTPELPETQATQLNDRIKSLVEKHQGTFFFSRSMGKKKLAYQINKQTKGAYYCVDYTANGDVVAELERMFRFDENVMRYLTVVKADTVDVEARRAEIAARGEDRQEAVVTETVAVEKEVVETKPAEAKSTEGDPAKTEKVEAAPAEESGEKKEKAE